MLKQHTIVLFAIGTFCVLLHAADGESQLKPPPRPLYEQSRSGVTVRLEKIAIQRILYEARRTEKQKMATRIVSIFITISGAGEQYGPFKVVFANDYETNKIKVIGKSPPHWEPHVGLKVDPKATGYEKQLFVTSDVKIENLFPATVTVHTTTKSGNKLEFEFKNVRF